MKIIYRHSLLPYIPNNRPARVGPYDSNKASEVQEDGALKYQHLVSADYDKEDIPEQAIPEWTPLIDYEDWDWFSDVNQYLTRKFMSSQCAMYD